MMKNRKAWIKLVGLVLASVLIFVSIMYLQSLQLTESSQPGDWGNVVLNTYAKDSLNSLWRSDLNNDSSKDLAKFVINQFWTSDEDPFNLEDELTKMLPDHLGFTFYLYDNGTISHKGGSLVGLQPSTKEIVSVGRTISGANVNNTCTVVPCSVYLAVWFIQ
ncbi:MAG: hypothetical protein QF775_00025 [archaeon]|jgi:hypothetical protein|nr:hypothetical protein [Euryarchaeota archaeon]MDP6703857.1 hypothetical protein [archaeon]|tara:strand:+ start:88999 stop:89484 length:486 start_codon:yes stop_codon:yes gene_type:complete